MLKSPLTSEAVFSGEDFIAVRNPVVLPAKIPCERTPLGIQGDYKPCIAKLKNGTLLIIAMYARQDPWSEYFCCFRSTDGGLTWSERGELDGPVGREPFIGVLSDGTLIMTSHILPHDANNEEPDAAEKHYWYSYVHRSTDDGLTWDSHRIGKEDGFLPSGKGTCTDRKPVELPDGTVLLGVSSGQADGMKTAMWRSRDFGRTWDKSTDCELEGWNDMDGFYSNSDTFLAPDGKLWHVNRVDGNNHPIEGTPPPSNLDSFDYTILWESEDEGRTWSNRGLMGYYCDHYGFFVNLHDGRILYNWTVRDAYPPLGIQAIIMDNDGGGWDFHRDRIIVESRTNMDANNGKPWGGGYGSTIQLDDGTLLTPYCYQTSDNRAAYEGFRLEVVRWSLP